MTTTKRVLPDWPRGMQVEMAAAYIGLSAGTLRAEIAAGNLTPAVRLTSGRLVHLSEHLDAYLDRKAGVAPIGDGSEWMNA